MLSKIYCVHLKLPFSHKQKTDYYFCSLQDIYAHFAERELGIKIDSLYAHGKLKTGAYENDKCRIAMYMVERKARKRLR